MATYYVRTDGSNDNNGLTYTTTGAWATIAFAISQVAASDTVRIAPQTFYETMTLATDGGAGSEITWWGDREAQYFLDLKPGPVRITGCSVLNGIGAGTPSIININAKAYNNFYNLVVDGNANGSGTYGVSGTAAITKFYDCIIIGGGFGVYGIVTTTYLYRCFVSGSYYGIYDCNSYNCIGFGPYAISYGNSYDSIAIGGYMSFYSVTTLINCISYGGMYGYYVCTNLTNCIAYTSFYGFGGTSTMIMKKCKAIDCLYGYYAADVNLVISDCKYANCYAISTGTVAGTATDSKYEGWKDASKLLKLATALKFDIFEQDWSSDLHEYTVANTSNPTAANNDYVSIGTYNTQTLYQSIFKDHLIFYSSALKPNFWCIQANATASPNEMTNPNYAWCATLTGTYTTPMGSSWAGPSIVSTYTAITFTEDYDILKHSRRMGSGILDCGAFEYSQIDMEWTTYKTVTPAIKISRKGQKRIVIPVKYNVAKTVSCWVYFDLDSGSNKPQMILSSSEDCLTTNPDTTTATGSEETWEQLSITFTPKADGLVFIDLYNRETGANAYGIFSDFAI